MKFLIYIIALVGWLSHHTAIASESKGRVIKVYPQGSVVESKSPVKEDTLEPSKEIKEWQAPVSKEAVPSGDNPSSSIRHAPEETTSTSQAIASTEQNTATNAKTVNANELEPVSNNLSFTLTSGLLKPQLNRMLQKFMPNHDVYWGNYEGKHEWYGEAVIEGESVEAILNKITSSYGKPPTGIAWYIHRNVVEIVYKNTKG